MTLQSTQIIAGVLGTVQSKHLAACDSPDKKIKIRTEKVELWHRFSCQCFENTAAPSFDNIALLN